MAERPLRADALRNSRRIVEVATAAFAEDGAGTSFEEIARRAGVGSGTLYRRFPTRAALFEAVYAEQVEQLLAPVDGAANARAALDSWLRCFVEFIIGKRAFAEEMAHDTELVVDARRRIYATATPLLEAAQRAGTVRHEVTADDILRMLSGIGLAEYPHSGQLDRVVEICLRGLNP
ncbi:helix-turn-helix transcriptional regulator [Herbiconiux sp. VKM Ac-1786]|jgi:AcrR family transcriptional regulator|uniref:TetR/AcrR family transcriptional regulator n=1 Tax=Herbiconiux sp. VKM Ac-1786 TaxID=2783824 RepID=UPI00188C4725|nr:TetR/AcrR family transcriptional regulator [Herbiconiux sp. VKM Ac-1786]MBF4571817.1 helix-turn-helix transcriptional regulator [Herbiconiux sp. VKM Ac-1786]